MKTRALILMFALILVAQPGFASSVYKCKDADGNTSFSFVPCAPAPVTVSVLEEEPKATSAIDQVSQLDARIADVQSQLDVAKATYNRALENSTGRSDELTEKFDKQTTTLLTQLGELQSKRRQAIQRRI